MRYLLLGALAGFAAVERKGFLQAMLSRPIALAPLAGLALGDLPGGIFVAPPLELFWLGAVNLGAALPVHEALATAAIAAGAVLAGQALGTGVTAAVALGAVLVCAPLALVGRGADRLVEAENERLVARAEAELACHHPRAAVRLNLLGLPLPFLLSALLAPLGAAAAAAVVPGLLRSSPGLAGGLGAGWWAFAGLATAGGVRALRARRAGALFGVAAAVTLAVGLVARGAA